MLWNVFCHTVLVPFTATVTCFRYWTFCTTCHTPISLLLPWLDSCASHCLLLSINWPLIVTFGHYSVLLTCQTLYCSPHHSFSSSYISSSTPTLTRVMVLWATSCLVRGLGLYSSLTRHQVTSTQPRPWTERGNPSMFCTRGPSTGGQTAHWKQSQSSSSRSRMSMTMLQHSLMDHSQQLCLRCLMLVSQEP